MSYEFANTPEVPSLHQHPIYAQGMAQIADGQWQQAYQSMHLLKGIYPDEVEVKELLDQVEMRVALARFQPRHSSRAKQRLNRRWLMVGLILAIIVAIATYVIYEMWINPVIIQELHMRQITNLRNEADEAIIAGEYARARQSLEKLQAMLPEDAQTSLSLQRIEKVERLSTLYNEAKSLMATGSWDQAIETLTELQSLDAEYRDLSHLLQVAEESLALDRQFQAAEGALADGDWASAIAKYEALRQANLTFRFDEIQARLFESHLQCGQALLEAAGADSDQVSEAISHFSEALKFRPMDSEALNYRHLAESYLAALNSENRDEKINMLQMIYNEQPSYAGNQVAQLLYIALLERADSWLEAGDQVAAIADYQVASQLLVEDPSEAEAKLAELTAEAIPE